jgi:DNA polymerase III epsilon subunit-like protein
MARRSKKSSSAFGPIIIIGLLFAGAAKLVEAIGWWWLSLGAVAALCLYFLITKRNKIFQSSASCQQNRECRPPTRQNARLDINKFLNVKTKTKIIVLDLETNGLDQSASVLSCSSIKYEIDPKTFESKELDRFNRYYLPVEPFNRQATDKNRLTKDVILERRGAANYPMHFGHDTDFDKFCSDVNRFVGHNISFDVKFLPSLKGKKTFCTMMTNTDIVAAEVLQWKNTWRYPKLSETASFYNIRFSASDLHSSMADVMLTAQIFFKMCNAIK